MDLKELRYFRVIAESGTLAKAAAGLRVAQPALSRQVKKLEHALGVELLHRNSRGVSPTAAGRALLKHTILLEEDVESLKREVSGFADQVSGSVRVAVTYPISTSIVPRLVRDCRDKFPQIDLHLIEGYSGNITDGLLAGSLDIALVNAPAHSHVDLSVTPLWSAEMRLIGRPDQIDSLGCSNGTISLAKVAGLPLILASRPSVPRLLIDQAFARHRLTFKPVLEADGPLMIMAMAAEGLGFTLFPRSVFQPMEDDGRLASMSLTPKIRRTMAVLTRAALLNERPIAHLITLMKGVAMELMSESRFAQDISLYPEAMADD